MLKTCNDSMILSFLNRVKFPFVELIPLLIVAGFFSSLSFDIDGDIVHEIDREGLFWIAIQRTTSGVVVSAILGAVPLVIRLTHGMRAFAPKLARWWGWGLLAGITAMPVFAFARGLLDELFYGTCLDGHTSRLSENATLGILLFILLSALVQAVIVLLRDRPLFWGLLVYSLAFYAVVFGLTLAWMYYEVLPEDYAMWMEMR